MRIYLISIPSILVIFIFSILTLSNCTRQVFDEEKWSKRINTANRVDLYAPNIKDGKFFNPWLPYDKEHSFLTVLKWKFSKASNNYTEIEELYFYGNIKRKEIDKKKTSRSF